MGEQPPRHTLGTEGVADEAAIDRQQLIQLLRDEIVAASADIQRPGLTSWVPMLR